MKTKHYLFAIILILLSCVALYMLLPAYKDYKETREENRRLQVELAEREARSQELGREINALRSDPAALERVAREKFGWCRDNEKIYHFDPNVPAGGTATTHEP